jgi:hypothetical protein
MFGWFKKKPQRLEPESKWVVAIDGDLISIRDEGGLIKSVAKSDLSGVAIETNNSGPWGADVWWLLFDNGDKLAGAFPQGATGEEAVIHYVSSLPSFDHGEMIKAMTSTDNAVFAVWRKQT